MEAASKGFLSDTNELVGTPARQSRWESLIAKSKQAVGQRRLGEAAGYAEEALALARHDWPGAHQLAESCILLADLRAALDRRSDALKLYGEAIGVLGELPDGVNANLAHAVSHIGRMFMLKGDQAKGQALAVAADALLRKLGEANSPSIKLTLAMAKASSGDRRGAEAAFMQAVDALDTLEPGDLQNIAIHDNFALYCLSSGEEEKAEILLRQCLILRQEAAGPRHPLNAAGLVHLGRLLLLYRGGNGREEAESLFRQARDIFDRTTGTPPATVLPVLYYLARVAQEEGANAEVGRLCNAMLECCMGDDRAAVAAEAAALHVTARLWAGNSEPAETEDRLRQALELTESMDGSYRRLAVDIQADALAQLAGVTNETGRTAEAERLSARAEETRGLLLWAVSRHVFMAPD